MKQILTNLALATLLTLAFVNCSSDDDESITNPDQTVTPEMGIFLDSEVEGLTFKSGDNPSGTTDENGIFIYTPGQPLIFSIGGVSLGTLADGSNLITPYDFIVPENIARFIQSLDADGDPTNGVDVTAASIALANQNVPSSVFENPSSTGFESDAAIIAAMATVGGSLIDTATANFNLANGTDSTFDPAELAGYSFLYFDPQTDDAGVVKFDELVNPNDMGSTGFGISEEDLAEAGSGGMVEEFTWLIDANGVLIITNDDGTTSIINRLGGSTRLISIKVTENNIIEYLTLYKAVAISETDLCGAPVTPGGVSTKSFTITEDFHEANLVTFKSDGTFTAADSGGVFPGYWSVGTIARNVLLLTGEIDPNLFPNDWRSITLLDGDLTSSGSLFIIDFTYNGFDISSGEPELIWEEFSGGTIVAN